MSDDQQLASCRTCGNEWTNANMWTVFECLYCAKDRIAANRSDSPAVDNDVVCAHCWQRFGAHGADTRDCPLPSDGGKRLHFAPTSLRRGYGMGVDPSEFRGVLAAAEDSRPDCGCEHRCQHGPDACPRLEHGLNTKDSAELPTGDADSATHTDEQPEQAHVGRPAEGSVARVREAGHDDEGVSAPSSVRQGRLPVKACPDPQGCTADGVPKDCHWCAHGDATHTHSEGRFKAPCNCGYVASSSVTMHYPGCASLEDT